MGELGVQSSLPLQATQTPEEVLHWVRPSVRAVQSASAVQPEHMLVEVLQVGSAAEGQVETSMHSTQRPVATLQAGAAGSVQSDAMSQRTEASGIIMLGVAMQLLRICEKVPLTSQKGVAELSHGVSASQYLLLLQALRDRQAKARAKARDFMVRTFLGRRR